MLDKNYLLKMQGVAKEYAVKRGHGTIAEDFAAQVVIDLIEGRPDNLDWLLTDFLRREYGNTRSLSGSAKSDARISGRSLDQPAGPEGSMCLAECIGSPEPDPDPVGSDWRSQVVLFGRAAIMAELHFDHEFDQRDIADMYGVTEARISQLLKPVKREIERAMIVAETADIYRDDKEYSKLEINWITL